MFSSGADTLQQPNPDRNYAESKYVYHGHQQMSILLCGLKLTLEKQYKAQMPLGHCRMSSNLLRRKQRINLVLFLPVDSALQHDA